MLLLGVGPVAALKKAPGTPGQQRFTVLTGPEAVEFLNRELQKDSRRLEAHRRAEAKLRSRGKTLANVTIALTEAAPAPQSALRRLAESVVPTLYASRNPYEYVIFGDYSWYDAHYSGTLYTYSYWTQTEVMMSVGFDKDPETDWADDYAELEYCNGSCPEQPEAVSAMRKIFGAISSAAYTTVAAAPLVPDWRSRLRSWAVCTVTGCSTAATACFIANVIDGEVLWAPCFVAWCGGSEVGCAVYAIIS